METYVSCNFCTTYCRGQFLALWYNILEDTDRSPNIMKVKSPGNTKDISESSGNIGGHFSIFHQAKASDNIKVISKSYENVFDFRTVWRIFTYLRTIW